jgi:hypothetical protein
MKRNEFIKKLRQKLYFLNRDERESEVLYYINEIDKSKNEDATVIKTFGSFDDIVYKACQKYGYDYKEVTEKNLFGKIKYFYLELIDLGTIFRNSDGKKKAKIIGDLLFLILITCFLKIPFIFIRDLGDKFIEVFLDNSITYLAIWGLIIEIFYVFFALYFFVKTFRKWFLEIKDK